MFWKKKVKYFVIRVFEILIIKYGFKFNNIDVVMIIVSFRKLK